MSKGSSSAVGVAHRLRRPRLGAGFDPGGLPSSRLESYVIRSGFPRPAGVDEAGRGAAAGPLVVAAVILDPMRPIAGLRDSKLLSAGERARLAREVLDRAAAVSVVMVQVSEVDHAGVHRANLTGIRRAVSRLHPRPDLALVDGFAPSGLGTAGLAVWKGDLVFPSIAAASIVAKHVRDGVMGELDERWPEYGFGGHKGYLTPLHLRKFTELGPTPVHRKSFAPVRRLLSSPEILAGDPVARADQVRFRAELTLVGRAGGRV